MKYLLPLIFSVSFFYKSYSQEKWVFLGYDKQVAFSNLCNKKTESNGMYWIYKNENFDANKKYIKSELKKKGVNDFKEITFVEGKDRIIAVVESSTYCRNAKIRYKVIRYFYGDDIDAIKRQIATNEKTHSNTKLKQEIVKIIDCGAVTKLMNKAEQVIEYN